MAEKSAAFEKTLRELLRRIQDLDLAGLSEQMGVPLINGALILPYFGAQYSISPQGVMGPDGQEPPFSVSVVLCRYVLSFPGQPPEKEGWVSYKDFPGSEPLAGWFRQNVERTLPAVFLGNGNALVQACQDMGGCIAAYDYPYDVLLEIPVLPHLNVLLLFNDADDGFPANSLVLFDNSAIRLLDVECLSVVGWTLTILAARSAGLMELED